MMNPAEFANIAAAERDLWWYRGMLRILSAVLQPYLSGRTLRRVLEAGCGTGYYSSLMQRQGWPIDVYKRQIWPWRRWNRFSQGAGFLARRKMDQHIQRDRQIEGRVPERQRGYIRL